MYVSQVKQLQQVHTQVPKLEDIDGGVLYSTALISSTKYVYILELYICT